MAFPMGTIYMTKQQDDELRSTIKARRQKCREVQAERREPRDPKALLAQATSAALMADMVEATRGSPTSDTDTMPALEIGSTYLPSKAMANELEPIPLHGLRMNTHHRGRILNLRRIGPVVSRKTVSWTIVQDLHGSNDAERLEIVLHGQHYRVNILEASTELKIKEPLFTSSDNGEPTLRIDHPSDIVWSIETECERMHKCYSTYKTDGNSALRQNDLAKAYSCYTQGLRYATEDKDARDNVSKDILRNRAHVNLLLGRFDEAITDATSSLTFKDEDKSQELNGKAYFRAGCAAYRLGEWSRAKGFFTQQLESTPDDRDAKVYLRKIENRLREEAGAGYQFEKMRSTLSKARALIDAATYMNSIDVRQIDEKGRGLFATRDYEEGEIILCEKAFCVVWSHENTAWTTMTYDVRDERIRAFPAGLAQALVQKLRNNPSQVEKVQALFSDYKGLGDSLITGDNDAIVDTFQIHDIICRNAFSPGPQFGEEDARKASAGLWIKASYMNHSCIPNTKREFIGDLMIVRATKAIHVDEEITHVYDDSRDLDERAESLMRTWDFVCSCPRCLAERADGPELRKQRQALEDSANAFVEENPVRASKLVIRKAENLAKAIEATYDAKRYEGVPRTALVNIERWLVAARSKSRR